MSPRELAKLNRAIIRRNEKFIRTAKEFIATVEWWNNNRADCEPMDCEDMKICLQLAIKNREARNAGKFLESERLSGEMVKVLNESCGDTLTPGGEG